MTRPRNNSIVVRKPSFWLLLLPALFAGPLKIFVFFVVTNLHPPTIYGDETKTTIGWIYRSPDHIITWSLILIGIWVAAFIAAMLIYRRKGLWLLTGLPLLGMGLLYDLQYLMRFI